MKGPVLRENLFLKLWQKTLPGPVETVFTQISTFYTCTSNTETGIRRLAKEDFTGITAE